MRALRLGLHLPSKWVVQSTPNALIACKLQHNTSQKVIVTHSITIKTDLSWSVQVHGKHINKTKCSALQSFPNNINTKLAANALLAQVDGLNVCAGHPDQQFLDIADSWKGKFQSANKSIVAFADNYFFVNLNGETYPRTIRTTACELLVHGTKCVACKQYRSTLRSLHSRKLKLPKSDTTAVSSHSNIRYLKTPERRKRMTSLKVAVDAKTAEVNRKMKEIELLKSKSRESTNRCGIYVTKEFEDDLIKIMEENNDQICQKYPSDSFHQLFWSQQLVALRVQDKRQIRWHPMMIRWCLSLKLISSASYHAL